MKKLITIISLTMILFLAGCFDYDETLLLNSDGSGTLQLKVGVDKSYLEQMKMMQEQMAKMMPEGGLAAGFDGEMFNKTDIEKSLAKDNSGVKLVAYEKSETERMQEWDMKFSFTDWQKLNILDDALSPDAMSADEHETSAAEEEPMLTKLENGQWQFYRSFDDMGGGEEDEYGGDYDDSGYDAEEDGNNSDDDYDLSDFDSEEFAQLGEELEAGIGQMAEQFSQIEAGAQDLKLRFSVTFPGEIIETNATTVEGKTAVWEYPISEMGGSPQAQTAIFKWDH